MLSTDPLSSDAIFTTVEDLVGFAPRATGTPGGERAARYVASRFESASLPEVRMLEVPSYAWSASRCSLSVDGADVPCSPIQHCGVRDDTHTGLLLDGATVAPMLDIGTGRVPAQARGAIVLFDLTFDLPLGAMRLLSEYRYDPQRMLRRAEVRDSRNPYITSLTRVMRQAIAAGAAGVIGVLRDYPDSNTYFNEAFFDQPLTLPGVWITRGEGERLRRRLTAQSLAEIDLKAQRDAVTSQSVIGVLPGRTNATIMVQSHHDSVTPGAVEDASGTAEVIALAEHFGARAHAGETREKTLLFVTFDTHFTGYHAHDRFSADYVMPKHPEFDIVLNATIEHIALRAVRGPDGAFVTTAEPEPRGIFNNLNLAWKWRIARMLRRHDLAATTLLNATAFELTGQYIPTDAADMVHSGIPTLSYISGPLYLYDAQDTLDKVDRTQLGPVARFFAEVLDRADTVRPSTIGLIPLPLRKLFRRRHR